VLFFLAMMSAVQAATCEQQLAKITHGLLREARLFIQRRSDCSHWAGEEGYDAVRRREIETAVNRLHCDTLDRDAAMLHRHYRHNAKVLTSLTRAARLDE
jgi:hypothetical protein